MIIHLLTKTVKQALSLVLNRDLAALDGAARDWAAGVGAR